MHSNNSFIEANNMRVSEYQLLAELNQTQEKLESTALELKHVKKYYDDILAEKNSKLQVLGPRCKALREEVDTLREAIGSSTYLSGRRTKNRKRMQIMNRGVKLSRLRKLRRRPADVGEAINPSDDGA